jgi:hypothetical protein
MRFKLQKIRPLRTLLIIFAALFIFHLPVSGQENKKNSKNKEQQKTQKHGMKDEEEEDENPFPLRKVEFGLNFGTYFANKYSANYYSGIPVNVNTVNYVMSNPTWNREIKQLLGLSESDLVVVDGYPLNMHYNVAFSGGLFMRVNFDRKNGLFLQANYALLRAEDVITLETYNTYLSFPDIRLEQVLGREGRVLIDLGYQRSFPLKSRINLFVQGGVTMCYTQMLSSVFVVEGREYDIVNYYGDQIYVPNTSLQTNTIYQNAFGFGGYLGVGAGIPLTEMFSIEPGFYTHYYPTNLENYPDFKTSFGLYLRILMYFGPPED